MITHLDHEFGRVLDALDEHGLTDDTLIVFAGDNGLAVGQHGLMGKQNCYEHSVRVPLIFAGPGVPEGRQSDAYVYLLDIFRTVCELTGHAGAGERRGGKPGTRQCTIPTIVRCATALYFAYVASQRAVKNRTHKLIEYAVRDRDRQTQLVRPRVRIPWETHNLYGAPGHRVHRRRATSRNAALPRFAWEGGHTGRGARFWERYAA